MKKINVVNRFFAAVFDFLIIVSFTIFICLPAIITFVDLSIESSTIDYVALAIASFSGGAITLCLAFCYLIAIPYFWNGQTLGKKFFGIRVVRKDGSDIGFKTLCLRELSRLLLLVLTFGMSTIANICSTFFSKSHQSFQDIMCSSQVIDVTNKKE